MSYLVPVVETFFRPTNPVTFLRGKAVYVYFRGTTEEVPLYTSSSGATAVSQPLTTDNSGMPRGAGGVVPWAPPVAVDFKVNGETISRELSGAAQQVLDAREWVGYTPTTSDRLSKWQKALDAARDTGPGAKVLMPPWKVTVSGPGVIDSFVELTGHLGASEVMVGAGSNSGALKSARYGAGGATGGTKLTAVNRIAFDGNFAQNTSATEPCVALDCVRPVVDLIHVKNGVINFSSKMSRTKDASGGTLEDGIFTRIGLLDPQKQNFLHEGPHDSVIDGVLARSNVASYPNIDLQEGCVLQNSHFYGNAQYSCRQAAGDLKGVILEGGRKGQLLITTSGRHAWGCFLFNGGGADGGIGIVLGEEGEGNIFDTKLYDFHFEKINNSVVRCNRTVSRLFLSGFAEGPEGGTGKVWDESAKEPKADCDFRKLGTRNLTDNTKVRKAENTFGPEGIHAGRCEVLEVSGKEINYIQFGETGQTIKLFFKEATKLVHGTGNLRLAGGTSFSGTENDTKTLFVHPNGNLYETGGAVI